MDGHDDDSADDADMETAFNEAMADVIVRIRDQRRPSMADVVKVCDGAFRRLTAEGDVNITLTLDGPDVWIWTDHSLNQHGFEKVYVLSSSTMEGAEGYPLMTVRQTIAPHFDAAVTLSTLIFGPGEGDIARSMAVLVANHTAAFMGVRDSMQAITRGGTPEALRRLDRDGILDDDFSPADPKKKPDSGLN